MDDDGGFFQDPNSRLCGGVQEPDDGLTIPRAAMNKMIKEILPNIRVANEARGLVLTCCTEFIHLISSESNEVCNQQQKKTISAEHVLVALHKLGFGDFVKEAEEVLHECKETAAKRRRQSTRLENLGIPEEELLRQQQELFAKAREAAVMQEQLQQYSAAAEAGHLQQYSLVAAEAGQLPQYSVATGQLHQYSLAAGGGGGVVPSFVENQQQQQKQ